MTASPEELEAHKATVAQAAAARVHVPMPNPRDTKPFGIEAWAERGIGIWLRDDATGAIVERVLSYDEAEKIARFVLEQIEWRR